MGKKKRRKSNYTNKNQNNQNKNTNNAVSKNSNNSQSKANLTKENGNSSENNQKLEVTKKPINKIKYNPEYVAKHNPRKNVNNNQKNTSNNQKNNSNNKNKQYNQNSNTNKNNINKSKLDSNKNQNTNKPNNSSNEKKEIKKDIPKTEEKAEKVKKVFSLKAKVVVFSVISILVVTGGLLGVFAYYYYSPKLQQNIFIDNIDVSNLTKRDAIKKINQAYDNVLNSDIKCNYNENGFSINLKDIDLKIQVEDSVERGMKIGRENNLLVAVKDFYSLKFGNEKNIDLNVTYDKEKLYEKLKQIESTFYSEVKQYSYTIDENTLKIQNGVKGISLNYEQFENDLQNYISQKNVEASIELPLVVIEPDEIDLAKIHSEVYKEMKNAYYTLNPFQIHNEEKGVNFDYRAAKTMIDAEPDKPEYDIGLIITDPTIGVDNLGLYDNELGSCTTGYVNNYNRTINLRLAASKVDGIILMPGEEFSYNETVGERTYSAGYRNAAIFVNGEVEDGLGGGICQISSTLYNAVVEANLEILERSNHARVPSYLPAGKDATVYWGSKDFRFKNNRDYPIKINISVEGGYATAVIYGTPTDNEYEISIETAVVSRYNGWLVVNAYKVYRQNGEEVNRELLSTDSYKIG